MRKLLALLLPLVSACALAQPCPEKNVMYWQAFPPGGESDLAARHQQLVLKKKCPAIETIVQYKPGAGGGLMWSQMNLLPGDGLNVVGMKRRDIDHDDIHVLRSAYRRIFASQDEAFEGRVAAAAESFAGHPMVAELIEFIRTESHRPLCQPAGDET